MAIEAHVVMLQNKLNNLFQSKQLTILCGSEKNDEEARKKLRAIYGFLMKEECQQSKEYNSWKKRLRDGMDKIEDDIDTYLYSVAAQRQRKLKLVADSWVNLMNKIRLQRAMQHFLKTTEGLSKDQYLVDCRPGDGADDDDGGQTPPQINICDWSEVSGSTDYDADTPSKPSREIKITSEEKMEEEDEDGTSRTSTSQYKGKQALAEQLKKAFSEDFEFEVSVVWGPDGVGKSAITRQVSNLRGIKGGFQWQVWVQMYKGMSYTQLLLRILNQVTHWVPMNPEDMPFSELTKLVYQQLVRNSVLIVLEDVEDFQILFNFLRGLIDSVSGSHVIITTKNKEAQLLVDQPIKLDPVPESFNSLSIFNDKPEVKLMDGDKIRAMRDSVDMSCGGLPLKISLLDKLLSTMDVQQWWPLFIDKQNRPIELDVYKLCYNMLPPHLKPCFLYLCLFPKSFPILIRRILRLWSAEDLIVHPSHKDMHAMMQNGTQVEDIAESYLLELVKRNLVEVVRWNSDGSPHTVHMNSNLYDAFLPVAASTGLVDVYGLKKKNDQQEIDYVRWYVEPEYRAAEENMKPDLDLLSENVKLGCPRSFVSFRSRKGILANDVGRFVKMLTSKRKLSLLRVLDLEGVYKPDLGNTLHKLLLLRYLGLRSTALESLPNDVGALPYLETLDIKHTNINKLPDSIWKMAGIRHLNLNGFHFNGTQLAQFSRAAFLPTLTTLTGFHIACRIDEHIFELLSRLTKLTKLGVYFHNPQESETDKIAKWIETLKALRYLKLGITGRTTTRSSSSNQKNNDDPKTTTPTATPTHQGQVFFLPDLSNHKNLCRVYLLGKLKKFDAAADKLPAHIKVLTLSMSYLEHDPMTSLGAPTKFLYLIELRLFADCYDHNNKIMTCPRNSFPNLKILKLWKLTSLEEIVPREGSLLNLELLEIRFCPNLVKNIFKLAEKLRARQTKLKEVIMFNNPPRKDVADDIKRTFPDLCAKEYNSSEEAISRYVDSSAY